MKRKFVLGTLVVIAAGASIAWVARAVASRSPEATRGMEVTRVARGDLTSVVKATGVVRAVVGAEVRVGSTASGVVRKLRVRVGDRVEKGQLLAEIDTDELAARRDQAAAALASARAAARYAAAELDRKRALAAREVVSRSDLDLAERTFAVAGASEQEARANLDLARAQLAHARIQAPIGGVVASVATQQGETVAASFAAPTFVTIVDLDRLEVWAYVDETDVGRIRAGQEARFTVDTYPDREFEGRVAEIHSPAARPELKGAATSLTLEDCRAIGDAPAVAAVVPVVQGRRGVRSEAGSLAVSVLGTTSEFLRVRNFALRGGRFIDAEDDAASARVVVLGARVGERLFEGHDPVGHSVRIDGVTFEVIGVLLPKGLSFDGADQDSDVYVPLQTARRRVFNQQWLSVIFAELAAARSVDSAAEEIRDLLRYQHLIGRRGGADDFEVQDPVTLLALRAAAARTLSSVSSGLGAISLLVGGTGILALMLLSVRERKGEIGLRRAVGARTRDILLQFLAEATALAFSGGVSGMILGVLGVSIVSATTGWEAPVSPRAALVSLAAAAVIGLAFGVVPAVRAARLTPVQALAQE